MEKVKLTCKALGRLTVAKIQGQDGMLFCRDKGCRGELCCFCCTDAAVCKDELRCEQFTKLPKLAQFLALGRCIELNFEDGVQMQWQREDGVNKLRKVVKGETA